MNIFKRKPQTEEEQCACMEDAYKALVQDALARANALAAVFEQMEKMRADAPHLPALAMEEFAHDEHAPQGGRVGQWRRAMEIYLGLAAPEVVRPIEQVAPWPVYEEPQRHWLRDLVGQSQSPFSTESER